MKTGKLITALLLAGFSYTGFAQTLADFANAGDQALGGGDFNAAIENYEKALALDSANIDYITAFNLGLAFEGIQDNKKALEAFKNSVLKGNDERAPLNKLKNNADAANCQECLIQAYIEIADAVPSMNVRMKENLFYIYAGQKENEKAFQCAQEILAEKPNNFNILKNTGIIYNNINQTDSATVYLEKAIAIKGDDADVNKVLGMILYNTCEDKKVAENKKYERGNKSSSSYNTMLYNRQTLDKTYYPKVIAYLKTANQTLNDPELTKLIARLNQTMSAYSK